MRQRIILLSFVLLGILFVVTLTLTRTYDAHKEALVREWAQAGDSTLAAGKPGEALEDYRNALEYDPENGPIQLHLAQSLLADGRLQEANTYFLNLWDRTPGSGILNLELARTSAQMGASDQAILYYRTAVLGGWDQQPELQRRNVRFELCEYLIAHGRTNDAQAEIAGLALDTPEGDAQTLLRVGKLYMKISAPVRALAQFELGLKAKPAAAALLEGAGQAAYDSGDYAKAEKYLARAVRLKPSDATREMLMTARQVQNGDPFLPALSDRERAERALADYKQALSRLTDCEMSLGDRLPDKAPELTGISKEIAALKPPVTDRSLQKDPEFQHQVMHLIFRTEDAAARSCGAPTGMDQALILIGKKHLESEQ